MVGEGPHATLRNTSVGSPPVSCWNKVISRQCHLQGSSLEALRRYVWYCGYLKELKK